MEYDLNIRIWWIYCPVKLTDWTLNFLYSAIPDWVCAWSLIFLNASTNYKKNKQLIQLNKLHHKTIFFAVTIELESLFDCVVPEESKVGQTSIQ